MTAVLGRVGDFLRALEDRERILIPCPFRTLFGIRCPGCGMTHAVIALARGDVKKSMEHNPFVIALIPLLAVGLLDLAARLSETISGWRQEHRLDSRRVTRTPSPGGAGRARA